jgi:hypothetical protein
MALTLLQAAQVSASTLRQGIVEYIVETSPMLARFPFEEAPSLRYEVALQKALPQSGFRALNANYQATNSTYDRATIHLKPLGGEVRIDRLLADVPDVNNQQLYATELRARLRSASLAYKRAVIKGNSANPAEFDGLQTWFDQGVLTEVVDFAPAGATIISQPASTVIAKMHEAIQRCHTIPDLILANRTIIGQLSALALAGAANIAFAQYFEMTKMDIGNINGQSRMVSVGSMFGIPVIAMDTDETGAEVLSFTEPSPDGSNNNCASMYFVCLGDSYVHGLQQSAQGPRVFEYVTEAGHKAIAVDWAAAVAVEHPRAVVRMRGIKAA